MDVDTCGMVTFWIYLLVACAVPEAVSWAARLTPSTNHQLMGPRSLPYPVFCFHAGFGQRHLLLAPITAR